MKALITGITGFVGSHLADLLLTKDVEVIGLTRWRSPKENIYHLINNIIIEHGDLLDFSSLYHILKKHKPNVIFHLAAQSYVPYSFDAPASTLEVNAIGTCNLLEAIRILRGNEFDPIVHVCSSSECYGQVQEHEVPITEENPLRPMSPYAVSKVCEDMLAFQYYMSWGMNIIRTRLFTHSVAFDSPLIIRDIAGLIDIVPISDIRKACETSPEEFWNMEDSGLEVWDGQKFTKILNISAHRLNGHKLLQLVSGGSIVQVTDNHSIFNIDDEVVDAGKLKIGDKIAVKEVPECFTRINSISEEFSWLLGFLVAEGDITLHRRICFFNKDRRLLNQCENFIKRAWGKTCFISKGLDNTLNVSSSVELARLFDDPLSNFSIYTNCVSRTTKKRYKKIPKIILNSSKKIQRAFLNGYNASNVRKTPELLSSGYREFKTSSPVLACGLIYLIKNVTDQTFELNYEQQLSNGMTDYYTISLCSNVTPDEWIHRCSTIKKIQQISEDRGEMVYDIETESHAFSCGIGSTKVHNTGPRRGDVFVVSNFAKQIAEIEQGFKPPIIFAGNLDSIRTFMDVRDAVRAYWLLINMCPPGEVYNIGGNITMSVKEMLDKLLSFSSVNIEVQIDPNRLRPSDVTLQIPSTAKFRAVTGWQPEISFDTTLQDTLNFWRMWVQNMNNSKTPL